MLLYQILAFAIHEKYKKVKQNNKFEISSTWHEEFELTDELYFVSNIQKYFEHMSKNMDKRLMIIVIF